jgi:hypothetical protein
MAKEEGKAAPTSVPASYEGHVEDSKAPAFSKGSVLQVGTAVPADFKKPMSPDVKTRGDRDWIG